MRILKWATLFIMAGLWEIWGGYLVWLWFRDGKSAYLGVLGGFILLLFGVVPTFLPAHFGRVYAAYAASS